MTDFQVRDLASAAGFAAAVYTLFNILITFGSGKPLAEWINPHRRYLLSLAAILVIGGGTLLARAAARHGIDPDVLLTDLIRHERAKPEVVGAVSFGILAVTLVVLYFWCRWILPRDPSTFSPGAKDVRAEYRRAMRHYLRWSRQLDYAAVFSVEGTRVEKQAHFALPTKTVFTHMARVDSIALPPDAAPAKAVEEQLAKWDELAARCFAGWGDLDRLVAPARQGENVLILFDLQFGGVFVELLQDFTAPSGEKVRVYLFVVCLNQHGLDSAAATRYYAMLAEAIRHIRSGSGKARG
jgi:hypothetical protein